MKPDESTYLEHLARLNLTDKPAFFRKTDIIYTIGFLIKMRKKFKVYSQKPKKTKQWEKIFP
jgi:hypothetical protein